MATGPSLLTDSSWQERVFITITKLDGSDIDFHSTFNEIGFSGGEKGMESEPLMNGGRRRILESEGDREFTGTMYPVGVSSANALGFDEWFHGSGDNKSGTTGVQEYETSLVRDDFRVVIMWTNDSAVSSATDEVAASSDNDAYRIIYTDCTLTEFNPNFDDQVLTADFTFTVPPFDASGNSRVTVQEYTGDSSNPLSSLSSYTSS